MKHTIKIDPAEYKGWKLDWCEQTTGNHFKAEKNGDWRFENSLPALLRAIDKAEQLMTLKLDPPMKVLFKDHYGTAFVPATIDAMCDGRLYITTPKGQRTSFVENLHDPKDGNVYGRDTFIHDSKSNHAILKRGVEMSKQVAKLKRAANELALTVKKVTEADVVLAAKKGGK